MMRSPWRVAVATTLVAAVVAGFVAPRHAGAQPPASPGRPAPTPRDFTSYGYPASWHPGEPATTPDLRTRPVPATVQVAPRLAMTSAALAPPPPDRRPAATSAPCDAPVADPCARPAFEAWGRYWRPTVSGTTLITRGGVPGTGSSIDAGDDLDLDAGDAFAVGIGWRPLGRHRLFVAYEALSFEGTARLPQTEIFRATLFPAGARVRSTLDFTFVRGGWDYGVVETATTEVRAGVSAWWWRYEQHLERLDGPQDASRSFSHVLPVAHVEATQALGSVHLAGRAAFGWVGTDRYAVDLEGGGGVRLFGRVDLDAGWRWMRFVFDETTNEGDLTFSGPFVGLAVEF